MTRDALASHYAKNRRIQSPRLSAQNEGYAPFHVCLREDRFLITQWIDANLPSQRIVPGMKILGVNAQSVHDYDATQLAPWICASIQQELAMSVWMPRTFLAGPQKKQTEPLKLELRDPGSYMAASGTTH